MSVNKYNHTSGELTTLANGSRCWIGTKAAYDAEKQAGTLPVNCLIAITDDSEDNNYSTDEKLTGKFWIDGKPIYRKIIHLDTYVGGIGTVIGSIANVDTIVDLHGICTWAHSNNTFWFPFTYDNQAWANVYWSNANSNVVLSSSGLAQNALNNVNVFVEYTKTTD